MINGHGDDAYKYNDITSNFSSNIYNGFDHEDLFNHLADRLDDVVSYPEPTPQTLERELSAWLGIQPTELCVTNGATEAIYLIAQAFRRSKSCILMPTFAEYADACRMHEHTIYNIFSLDEIRSDAQIVWLCNPNNPTGTVVEKDALVKCIERHPDTVFVLDASYAPYTLKPLISIAEAICMPNVMMLHSMTKEYGIPGLRLGYATASEALLNSVRCQRMPWSVNQVAIEAGRYLLCHADEFVIDTEKLIAERQRMENAFKKLGCIELWPSDSHMLLCRLRIGKASALKDFLANEHGILIRDASNFASLNDGFFRIAVQTPEENDALVRHIAEWICM